MDNTMFGKLDTTEKKDIELLEEILEKKRNSNDLKDEIKPVSA